MSSTISFLGGAGAVTGSQFLFETAGLKILVDCGLFQGDRELQAKNPEDFKFNPADLDLVFITHAHIDHIGRLPKLVAEGYVGPIYCTEATADLIPHMLNDSQSVLEMHARREDVEPLYTKESVAKTLQLLKPVSYHYAVPVTDDLTATFYDAGHILGSGMIKFSRGGKNMYFTGDLGNSPSPILRDTEWVEDADYMLIESVYGNRNHEDKEHRLEKLERAVEDTIDRKGTLLIPVFSLERTQEILFILNNLVEGDRIPSIPIFLDSPLAIRVTEVYHRHLGLLNDDVKTVMESDNNVFDFPRLQLTESTEESKGINTVPGPKIILAGSGMSAGGRILHHEMRYLEDENNMILFVGYQGAGTIGRQIREGAKKIRIYRNDIRVRAEVREISGFSGHKDSDRLVEFVSKSMDRLQHVYVAMGEPKASQFLAQRIRDYLGVRATTPSEGDVVEIDF